MMWGHNQDQAVGTIGGTLIAFIAIVDGSDMVKTAILACIGAVVSFGISRGMQVLWPGEKPKE